MMAQYINPGGMHPLWVELLSSDLYDRGQCRYTGTEVQGPAQARILRKQHAHQIRENITRSWYKFRGQAIHESAERRLKPAPDRRIIEKRFYVTAHGVVVGLKPDLVDRVITPDHWTIYDWKSVILGALKDGVKDEWKGQLNLFKYGAEENGIKPVKELRIMPGFMDWTQIKALRHENPDIPGEAHEVEIWAPHRVRDYLHHRVEVQLKADDGDVPECTPEERWFKADTWAVQRKGTTRAFRVLDSAEEAHAMARQKGAGWSVQFRPGKAQRCEYYCNVSDFCKQYQRERAGKPVEGYVPRK